MQWATQELSINMVFWDFGPQVPKIEGGQFVFKVRCFGHVAQNFCMPPLGYGLFCVRQTFHPRWTKQLSVWLLGPNIYASWIWAIWAFLQQQRYTATIMLRIEPWTIFASNWTGPIFRIYILVSSMPAFRADHRRGITVRACCLGCAPKSARYHFLVMPYWFQDHQEILKSPIKMHIYICASFVA